MGQREMGYLSKIVLSRGLFCGIETTFINGKGMW